MHVTRTAIDAEARRWGPTWREMKETAIWLGTNGIVFQFNDSHEADAAEEYGLPHLTVFDERWDACDVRVGDWLVLLGPHRISVVDKSYFAIDFTKAEDVNP